MMTRGRAPLYWGPALHFHAPRPVALCGGERNEETPATENEIEKCLCVAPVHVYTA